VYRFIRNYCGKGDEVRGWWWWGTTRRLYSYFFTTRHLTRAVQTANGMIPSEKEKTGERRRRRIRCDGGERPN
jgi:hypothetical protein